MFKWFKGKTKNTGVDTIGYLKTEADEYDLDILEELEPKAKVLEAHQFRLKQNQDVRSGILVYYKVLNLRMLTVEVSYDSIYWDSQPYEDELLDEQFNHDDLDYVYYTIYENHYLQSESGYEEDIHILMGQIDDIQTKDKHEYEVLNNPLSEDEGED